MLRTLLAATAAWLLATPAVAACGGDCDGDGAVTIAELVRVVAVVLGDQAASACAAADADSDGVVGIEEAVVAVRAAVAGCGVAPACTAVLVASGDRDSSLDGPDLTVHPDGSFDVVTTRSQAIEVPEPALRGEVIVHRFAGDGQPRGETLLAARPYLALAPLLARLPSGGGVVAWEEAIDDEPSPSGFVPRVVRLAMRRYGEAGAAVGSVVRAAVPNPGETVYLGGLSADASGTALLLWLDIETSEDLRTIYRSRFRLQRPDGLGPQRYANCFWSPAAFAAGNEVGAVCLGADLTTLESILHVVRRSGAALESIATLGMEGDFLNVGAAAGADRIVAVWTERLAHRDVIKLQGIGWDGATLFGPIGIGVAAIGAVPPAVVLHANGDFAVAHGSGPVRVQRYGADGSPRGQPLVLAAGGADRLALGGTDDGDLVAAWWSGDIQARLIPAAADACD